MKIKFFFIKYANFFPFSINFLLRFYPKKIIFPFYHAVSDKSINYINHLYHFKSIDEFERDLDFLLKYFQPISIKKMNFFIKNNKKLKENSFLLSFDDGLSSFYDIYPILLDKKIPPICFLNNKFIDNKNLFYRFKVSILIDEIKNINISEIKFKQICKILKVDLILKEELIKWLLSCSYTNNSKLDELAKIFNFSFKDFLDKEKPYLTKVQIKELQAKGVNFGGHSLDHINFNLLNEKEQVDECLKSVNAVCKSFETKLKLFSFPFSDDKISGKTLLELENNDIISFGTAGLKDELFANHFQRIPMEYHEYYSAKNIIKGELIYYLFKRLLSKNTINR